MGKERNEVMKMALIMFSCNGVMQHSELVRLEHGVKIPMSVM